MASVSIVREERNGTVRYRVLYRLGGHESKRRHGGSFVTRRLAEKRRDWIAGELANQSTLRSCRRSRPARRSRHRLAVFSGFGSDRFRSALTRACKALGIPSYSPHDLRHRRASCGTWAASP